MAKKEKESPQETQTGESAHTTDLKRMMYSYNTSLTNLEEENRMLRDTVNVLKAEIDRYREPSLMVCEVSEIVDDYHAIIVVPNGNQFYVTISSEAREQKIRAGDTVLCEQKNLSIIRRINDQKRFNVDKFVIIEKPTVKWEQIGGLHKEIQEVREVIELPLLKPELFKKVGIKPPKGILLYGPPGTGKTLIAKAVAQSTNSTFIEVVGSELVQKFIGEGAKLVKEIFELAKQRAPSIIFVDEIDSLAAKRIELGTSGEREVQRTFMQFLAEIDGFKSLENVKVIAATNRRDILDPAILRPGRLDRQIMIPLPNKEGIKEIFKIHTKNMNIHDVAIDQLLPMMEGFSGAEINAVCTEAGYFAIRENTFKVTQTHFIKAIQKVKEKEAVEGQDYLKMFG
ncbi:MAG: AAA family ATPase [Candidatus Woesearchaeota archaeon]